MNYLVIFSLGVLISTLWHSLGLLVGLIVIVVVYSLSRSTSWSTILLRLGACVVGVVAVLVYDRRLSSPSLQISSNDVYTIEARENSTRYTILSPEGRFFLYSEEASLQAGDRISTSRAPVLREFDTRRTRGVDLTPRQAGPEVDRQAFSREFDYDAWLYMRGIAGSIFDSHPVLLDNGDLPWYRSVRESILMRFATIFAPESGALARGMLLGDRSGFDLEQYHSFVDSGLVHLIAVSGTHMAIMIALGSLLLLWMPLYPRIIVLGGFLVIYALMVGFHASIVRASIMSLITLVVILPGRSVSYWRLLAYARVLILLWNPYMLVYDLGFALSFGALLGIIYVDKSRGSRLTSKLRTSSSVFAGASARALRIVLASAGATLGTIPVLGFFTGSINLLSPLLNALVIPLVPLCMALLVASTLVSWPFLAGTLESLLSFVNTVASRGTNHALMLQIGSLGSLMLLLASIVYILLRIPRSSSTSSS